MCISVKFLKIIVPINAWMVITIGTVVLVAGVIKGVDVNWDAKIYIKSGFGFTSNIFSAIFYILGSSLIFIGIIGSVGAQQRNVYCLMIFNLFIILLTSIMFIAGVVALILAVDLSGPSLCIIFPWFLKIIATTRNGLSRSIRLLMELVITFVKRSVNVTSKTQPYSQLIILRRTMSHITPYLITRYTINLIVRRMLLNIRIAQILISYQTTKHLCSITTYCGQQSSHLIVLDGANLLFYIDFRM